MTHEDQQRLNGWHACENGEPFNFLMPKTWQQGWLLYSDTEHLVRRLKLPIELSRPATTRAGSRK